MGNKKEKKINKKNKKKIFLRQNKQIKRKIFIKL